jgi:hypothetical protein
VVDPASAAPSANEEEYPQANGRRCKANDQKDTSNSTGVVKKPIAYEYIGIMHCAVKAYLEEEPELSLLERTVGFEIT